MKATARPVERLKTVTRADYVRRRGRQASLLSFSGIAILLLGLYLNFRHVDGFALIALIAGSIASWSGIALAERWLKPPREDQALDRGLQRAGRAFALYHWTLAADHVLAAPWGLTVLTPSLVDTEVYVSPDRWRETRPLLKRLMTLGRRTLGNPPSLAAAEADALRAQLAAHDPELAEIPVDTLVVFTRPAAQIAGTDPAQPWARGDALGEWVTASRKRAALPPSVRRRLEQAVDELAQRAVAADAKKPANKS